MKLCDLCHKIVPRLEPGPKDIEPRLEVCDECHRDLLQRVTAMERRIAEIRRQQRNETLADWQRERAALGIGT